MAKKKNNGVIIIGASLAFLFFSKLVRGAATQFAQNFQVLGVKLSDFKYNPPISLGFVTNVEVSNFNNLPVTIRGANLRILLDGNVIGNMSNLTGGVLPAGDSKSLPVETSISLVSLGIDIATSLEDLNINTIVQQLFSRQLSVQGQVFGTGNFAVDINEVIRL